jgi:hypothetical protein
MLTAIAWTFSLFFLTANRDVKCDGFDLSVAGGGTTACLIHAWTPRQQDLESLYRTGRELLAQPLQMRHAPSHSSQEAKERQELLMKRYAAGNCYGQRVRCVM